MNRVLHCLMITAAAILPVGCHSPAGADALWEKISQLQQQKNELETRAETLEAENRQLIEQCHALDSIDRTIRLAALDRLVRIEIGRHSRLTDQNEDGLLDTLTVHLLPIDRAEDVVKAPGQVKVSLWHLDPATDEHLLGEWTVPAEDLKTRWGRSLLGQYYRLTFDLPHPLPKQTKDLTVRVEFTDYLIGKILKAQKVIRPE